MASRTDLPRPGQIDFPGFEIERGDTLVDVGCGDGTVCAFAGHLGADVIGLDIDPDCLALADLAMRGVPARSWRGILSDCDPIPLPDASASVVVCTEVLEHVADPSRLAAELARIGKPGARYLISVPHPVSESIMALVAPGWYWEPPYHRRVFECAQLEALLAGAGLEVRGRGASGVYWSLWWAFRMAVGDAKPYAPTPDAPLLKHWEETWKALMAVPGGNHIAESLDRLVPKSQILLARKAPAAMPLGSFGGPIRFRSRWRRSLRDGLVRMGSYEFRWAVRRAAARHPGEPAS
jgi:SAM-dependent methyltransferase